MQHTSTARRQGSVLGCILSQFPRYDEAFILRELVALSHGPQELAIFSLRPCRDRVVHNQATALIPQTRYAPFVWSAALWRSHASFLTRSPRAYWGALGWIFSRHWNHPVILMKTLAFFPKTVHFARLALEGGVTHLHAFWATYPAASAMLMSRLTGIPYSVSGHAHDIHTTNPTLVEKIRGAQFIVTCTEDNRRRLESLLNGAGGGERGAGEQTAASHRTPVVVSYHGVDLSRFAPVQKSGGETCRLLVVGSLFPCKGLETLVETCRLLRDRGMRVACTMAGGGPLERSLRRLIAKHGLGATVEITGYVSQERVAVMYQQAHLFVLPLVSKIHWGIPNVLIEALATKTPVICCDLPSMRELIEHGRSGWIIPEDDPAALADAVTTLWADPARRAAMAELGYQRVAERFSLERTGEALRRLFAGSLAALQESRRASLDSHRPGGRARSAPSTPLSAEARAKSRDSGFRPTAGQEGTMDSTRGAP